MESHHESVPENEESVISRNQGSFKDGGSQNNSLRRDDPQEMDPSSGSDGEEEEEIESSSSSSTSTTDSLHHTHSPIDHQPTPENSNSSENVNHDSKPSSGPSRPPRPAAMKIPSRPSRPFPPPPQARLLEARLAKKKPPPPRPTVIDTRSTVTAVNGSVGGGSSTERRSSNTSTNQSETRPLDTTDENKQPSEEDEDSNARDLKMMQMEVSTFSNIPKRPPPPTSMPSQSKLKEVSEETTPKDEPINNCIDETKQKEIPKNDEGTVKSDEEDAEDQLEPLPSLSPQHDKKLMSKMKSSFRHLTQRKKRRDDNPSSSRRTIAGSNPSKHRAYDQKRYPDKLPVGILSPLVIQCVAYLNNEECLTEPGLFRIPGDMSMMKRYRANYAYGEEVNLSECLDPHTVAGLLKLHFREQRQCIIPGDALIHKIALAVEGRDVSEFKSLIESVDVESQAAIRMLAELLKKISQNSDVNHMTSGTLATSCGPSFFPRLPPSSANAVLKFMTDNCDKIFGS